MALQTTETEYNLYTVASGDTIYSIAKNNNTNVQDIIKFNNLSGSISKSSFLYSITSSIS